MAGGGIFTVGKVTGVDALGITLKGLEQAWIREMQAGITEEAVALMNEANTLVPTASGTLRASTVVAVENHRTGTVANATYTDKKAAAVHEGIHWGIRSARAATLPGFKWYERTVGGFAQGFVDRMLARCLAVIERGRGAE